MPTPLPDHVPVLLSDVLKGLHLDSNQQAIDATLGGGGHSRSMLAAVAPDGRVLGVEADQRTLTATADDLASFGSRFVVAQGNFRDLERIARERGFDAVDGILFDLGLSSIALADAERGFSFQQSGPLDMRFDRQAQTLTAAQIVNERSVQELRDLFRTYGEEPVAERIAQHLVEVRRTAPFTTTDQLAEAISAIKHRRGRIHPATQVFQTLRIVVNDEYGAITSALPQALTLLKPGGRLAVITFHSGEDRIVKQWIKAAAAQHLLTIVNKHVIVAGRPEQISNPRSRSAKLRIIIKNPANTK